jgi:hypothetical protein
MTTTTFPNNQTLVSSALTPEQITAIFQQLTCSTLGIWNDNPVGFVSAVLNNIIAVSDSTGMAIGFEVTSSNIPSDTTITAISGNNVTLSNSVTATGTFIGLFSNPAANTAVRTAWQKGGAPAWTIDQDVVSIQAIEEDNDYNKVRDMAAAPNNSTTLVIEYEYTRAWRITWVFRGPNAFDHARILKSALLLDWTSDTLSASNLYVQPNERSTTRIPELFEGQWWERSDVSVLFYEQVNESTIVNSVVSVPVVVEDSNGVQVSTIIAN